MINWETLPEVYKWIAWWERGIHLRTSRIRLLKLECGYYVPDKIRGSELSHLFSSAEIPEENEAEGNGLADTPRGALIKLKQRTEAQVAQAEHMAQVHRDRAQVIKKTLKKFLPV